MTARATVTLIEGRHITASDKAIIREGIEVLRTHFADEIAADPTATPDFGTVPIRRGSSPKCYFISPDPNAADLYTVEIDEVYRTDFGERRIRRIKARVRVRGIEPLTRTRSNDLFTEQV